MRRSFSSLDYGLVERLRLGTETVTNTMDGGLDRVLELTADVFRATGYGLVLITHVC